MRAESLIASLERFGPALVSLLKGVAPAEARWKPPSGAWSIVEIVSHLADEEVEDFRPRLRSVLHDPAAAWAALDPEKSAVERRYNENDLGGVLQCFAGERTHSVAWLRTLKGVDWSLAHPHPKFGPISAATLLGSWAAHDALHLRQIAKRMFEMAQRDAGGASVKYAGEWSG